MAAPFQADRDWSSAVAALPPFALAYPHFRIMGSKHRLLPWLHEVLSGLRFDSAADAFAGSGCVSYLFKTMGKRVHANDSLHFPVAIARALTENDGEKIGEADLEQLLAPCGEAPDFVHRTFRGIFFSDDDLHFIDLVSCNLRRLPSPHGRALALTALMRACLKKQPRGVFTVAGGGSRYDDGRRDLLLSIREHFVEQVSTLNGCVFSNGRAHSTSHGDALALPPADFDLVYLDPPYVPRADDNCYVKRYHFIEGLATYWEGAEILYHTRVRKIRKPYTPFSYRRTALAAFARLFSHFRECTILLSYSSNAYPELDVLLGLMRTEKKRVEVFARPHRYHFGTHRQVRRSAVQEYLILGLD